MIQRKQTFFLLVAFLLACLHLAIWVFPLLSYTFATWQSVAYAALSLVILGWTVTTIFSYRHLRTQAILCRMGGMLALLLLLWPLLLPEAVHCESFSPNWLAFAKDCWKWILSAAAFLMALRGINADRKLLASAYRIR